jgi:hypothetical protein
MIIFILNQQKTWGTGKTGIESLGPYHIVVIGNNDLLPVI